RTGPPSQPGGLGMRPLSRDNRIVMVRPDPQVSRPPSDDHALSVTPQAVRLFHRLIVWLGLRDSVVAITIPLVLLSSALAVLLRILVAPPMGSFGYVVTAGVAAAVTLMLG